MPASKRLIAPLIVLFGVIIAVVAFAGPANAYPPGTLPTTSVSNQTPVAGSSITFCGSNFKPGETIAITLGATAEPSAVADGSGSFCSTIVLGASLTGTVTLTATGTVSGNVSSQTIRIGGSSASGGTSGGLAFTGAAVIAVGALGGLLLVGGATMVLASRRRKASA
jgi:hypothetical protein